MNPRELPSERLATTDESGRRLYLYPADVTGLFRKWRHVVNATLILVFLGLPWVRIGGHQALLLDLLHGRFAIFGLTFWAHDAPMLLFVAGGAVLTLAFVTAVWGRAWCGWACPQTVFIDAIFRRIERWIEGDSLQRRRLDESADRSEKFSKKIFKWVLFTLAAMVISHSFLAYFVGTEALGKMMSQAPSKNPGPFLFMAAITGALLFDFGWFREQFCVVVCPYGRFQSVLMDDRSKAIVYDYRRGEPRKGSVPVGAPSGDCVNCYRCVQVCPTGIDIRRGVQMECIACTACADACDDVMSRLKKPSGLIGYGTQAALQGEPRSVRFRAWIYLSLILTCLSGLVLTVRARTAVSVKLVRAIESPYQQIQDEDGITRILNHYKIDLRNQSFDKISVEIRLPEEFRARGMKIVISNHAATIEGGFSERADLFIRFPKEFLRMGKGSARVEVIERSIDGEIQGVREEEVRLVGPFI